MRRHHAGRRQAEQVETEPADERHAVGFRRGLEPLLFQPREDKRVNRIARPQALAVRPAASAARTPNASTARVHAHGAAVQSATSVRAIAHPRRTN